MSDSRSRIDEDENEYIDLCRKYGEPVQIKQWYAHNRTHRAPDAYGAHAASLKDRQRKQQSQGNQ